VKTRHDFLRAITGRGVTHASRVIALLWYYRETQEFEERSANELANDLLDEGFPKPNVTRLKDELRRSRYVVRGRRAKTFQIDARKLEELEERYGQLLNLRKVTVSSSVLPTEWFQGTRPYLERMAHQINGSYEYGFYDACAVLARRLVESLLIEVYISSGRQAEIQTNGVFLPLERLISYIRTDAAITLGRNSPKTMTEIKQLGDTAAHDRTYITEQLDLDDAKARYRKLVKELMVASGIGS